MSVAVSAQHFVQIANVVTSPGLLEIEAREASRPRSKHLYPVVVDTTHPTSYSGKLSFDIPGSCGPVSFSIDRSETYLEGTVTVSGRMGSKDSCYCSEGAIVLTKSGRLTYAEFLVDTVAYEMWSIGSEGLVSEIDSDFMNSFGCGNEEESTEDDGPGIAAGLSGRSEATCEARILFTYNDKAAADYSVNEIRARALNGVELFNRSSVNSQIKDEVGLSVAGIEPYSFAARPLEIITDTDRLANQPAIQALRDQHFADVVALLTGERYATSTGRVASTIPGDNTAYAIVSLPTAGIYTTPHELGHLFGGQHTHNGNPNAPLHAHAHDFKYGIWPCRKRRKTLISNTSNYRSIFNFSNPNVSHHGNPTGVADEYDNAAYMFDNGCPVSTYRVEDGR